MKKEQYTAATARVVGSFAVEACSDWTGWVEGLVSV